jgi:hypothetical protein
MTAKADALDEQIGRLIRLRDSLRHAAVCEHEPLVECPDFKRAVGNVASVSAALPPVGRAECAGSCP